MKLFFHRTQVISTLDNRDLSSNSFESYILSTGCLSLHTTKKNSSVIPIQIVNAASTVCNYLMIFDAKDFYDQLESSFPFAC